MRYFNEDYYKASAEFALQENRDYDKSPLKDINEKYNNHVKNHPEWYKKLSFHDSFIIKAECLSNKFVLTVKYDLRQNLVYKICFYDYEIIENCNLIETTIIYNELYIGDGNNEFHLMVDELVENQYMKRYFTVKFGKMEIAFGDLVYSVGNGIDESLNPSVDDLEYVLFSENC